MSGAVALCYLLAHDSTMIAAVPAAQIFDDDPPAGNATFPLITVEDITSNQFPLINPTETPRSHTDRVQVTAKCRGQYQGDGAYTGRTGCRSILAIVLQTCKGRGSIGGINVSGIVPDVQGPSIHDVADDTWSQSRDFIVRWNE